MSGLDMIRAIQSAATPTLDTFFYVMTQIHHENFYLLVVPLVLWLYDKRFGRYLTSVFLFGYWANNVLKHSFDTARPSPNDVRVIHPETGTGPAFPSGHSQNPLMFWGALALHFRRPWFSVLAGVIVFLIGFSRLYLGLHWPLDVLGGWTIGALMLYGFELTHSFWMGEKQALGTRLLWAVIIPLGTFVVALLTIDVPPKDIYVLGGAYLGFWVGTVLEDEWIGFDPRAGSALVQVVKVLIGVVLVLAAKEGLKPVLPGGDASDFVRYTLVTVTATLLAPWIFRRFLAAPPAGRSLAQ